MSRSMRRKVKRQSVTKVAAKSTQDTNESKQPSNKFLTLNKFHNILKQKYGITLPKAKLTSALKAPANTLIEVQKVDIEPPKLLRVEQPEPKKRRRLSYLHRMNLTSQAPFGCRNKLAGTKLT